MTKEEFVSRVSNSFNSVNKDARIPKRYTLSIGKNFVKDFLAKRMSDKRGKKEPSTITILKCVEFEKINSIECGIVEFRVCKKLMKSKLQLPEEIGSNSIVAVYSIDNEEEIYRSSIRDFNRNKYRAEVDYYEYYMKDGYMYIPNSDIRAVEVHIITVEDYNHNICDNIWETKFIVPDNLIKNVVDATINEISISKRIPKDENPNLNENIRT